MSSTTSPAGSTVPIACTLGAGEMSIRLDKWRALLELAPSSDVTEIARLAAAEHECCQFFGFAVTIDDRGLALEVHAPADGQPVLADLFGTAA